MLSSLQSSNVRGEAFQEAGKEVVGYHRVLIIGTGFAGLGAAIRLLESGEEDVILLEKAEDVGGCWRDNTYPGLQCDVQSVVYSYSFAPNPEWSREFPWGSEIHEYLRNCAERFDLYSRIHFETEVTEARWDHDTQSWRVQTSQGLYLAENLIAAHGALSAPYKPEIPGLSKFSGPVFHSAEWRQELSLRGKRVAVVGTGASAIQIIPSIQSEVSELQVYQRTPAWVLPRHDGPVSKQRKLLYRRIPLLQKLIRARRFALLELRILGIIMWPTLLRFMEWRAKKFIASQVRDPSLREALTPNYRMGCKRILLSNEFYPALTQPNVELITQGIQEIGECSITTTDGKRREVDVIVLCTGFSVADHPMYQVIYGRDGRSLADIWSAGAFAYLGLSVPRFPNLFLLLTGPHTGLGHNSIVYMIEAQLDYLCQALSAQRTRDNAIMEVREEVVADFTKEMKRKLAGTVWSSGCTSFYLDQSGQNIAIWPGFAMTYRQRTRHFEAEKYTFSSRTLTQPLSHDPKKFELSVDSQA